MEKKLMVSFYLSNHQENWSKEADVMTIPKTPAVLHAMIKIFARNQLIIDTLVRVAKLRLPTS